MREGGRSMIVREGERVRGSKKEQEEGGRGIEFNLTNHNVYHNSQGSCGRLVNNPLYHVGISLYIFINRNVTLSRVVRTQCN